MPRYAWTVAVAASAALALPFGRSWAGDVELPRPLGVGVTVHAQRQNYDLSSITLDPENLTDLLPADLPVDNEITEVNIKVDCWLLPFANLFGLVGDVQGQTSVAIEDTLTQQLLGTSAIEVDIDGTVYGGGMTLALGHGSMFASLTSVLTGTKLSESSSSVSTVILTPKGGAVLRDLVFGQDLTFWLGAMYQDTDESHSGSYTFEGLGEIGYQVELEDSHRWNYLAGLSTGIGSHLQLDLEGGFGRRIHAMGALGYRF